MRLEAMTLWQQALRRALGAAVLTLWGLLGIADSIADVTAPGWVRANEVVGGGLLLVLVAVSLLAPMPQRQGEARARGGLRD